jgi:hypothetical protein
VNHHFLLVPSDRVLPTFFAGLASNHDPPDLCLPSSGDYRRELPHLALSDNLLLKVNCRSRLGVDCGLAIVLAIVSY